jgi:quercetin dioxygenase-like cupin family protein
MNRKTLSAIGTGIAGLAFGLGIAVGQQPAPTENKGLKVGPPTALDLSREMDSVEGRQLRLRVITLEPGGVVAVHSHNGRPAVAYIVEGTLTEHRGDDWVKERQEGETIAETKDVTHWAENRGDKPVVVVAVDVFKP